MILQMLCVYDSKAGAHSTPFFTATLGLARRAFSDAANMPDHPVGKNPADYTLFLLGTWDDQTAVLTALPEHKNLGLASNFVKENSDVRKIA